MSYSIKFVPSALKEWKKLDSTLREEFKNILINRLENPCIPKQKLTGYKDIFKIKLKSKGYRLIYRVLKDEVIILILAIGKRDKNAVYEKIPTRY